MVKKLKNMFLNIIWIIKPYWKYAKKYCVFSLVFFSLILPLSRYVNVVFPELVIKRIDDTNNMTSIIAVVAFVQLVLFIIPAVEDYYNARIRDVNEAVVETEINRTVYEKASMIEYKYIDNPDYYRLFRWCVEHYYEQSKSAFELLLSFISSVIIIISLMAVLVRINVLVIVATTVCTIIRIILFVKYEKEYVARDANTNDNKRKLDYYKLVFYRKEYAADLRTTKLKSIIFSNYKDESTKYYKKLKDYSGKLIKYSVVSDFIYHLSQVVIIFMVIYSIIQNDVLNVSAYITAMLSVEKLDEAFYEIFNTVEQIIQVNMYAKDMKEYFSMSEYIETSKGNSLIEKPFKIEFKHVYFKYSTQGFKINDINFVVEPKEKIAIVGDNGAGKSTLVKLLLRLYDVDEGEILINGINIKEYDITALRSMIGTVFQVANIYSMTLEKNLSLYRNNLYSEENNFGLLRKLIEKNGIRMDSELTKEFDENGKILSVGENQVIALARVINGDFGAVILDEPSSALDPIAEAELTETMSENMKNTTSIIIAHRLSSIKNVDKIIVMKSGEIIENGNHNELMRIKGYYYEMFNRQKGITL